MNIKLAEHVKAQGHFIENNVLRRPHELTLFILVIFQFFNLANLKVEEYWWDPTLCYIRPNTLLNIYFCTSNTHNFGESAFNTVSFQIMSLAVLKLFFLTKRPGSIIHQMKAYRSYWIAESLHLINFLTHVILMNKYMDKEFIYRGFKVLNLTKWNKNLISFLPVTFDGVYEATFVFLWFFYCYLFIYTIVGLVHFLAVIYSPEIRLREIRDRYEIEDDTNLKNVIYKLDPPSLYCLDVLSKNLTKACFTKIINNLCKKKDPLQKKKKSKKVVSM